MKEFFGEIFGKLSLLLLGVVIALIASKKSFLADETLMLEIDTIVGQYLVDRAKIYDDSKIYDDISVWTDQPEKTHDGYILVNKFFSFSPGVFLVDSNGNVKRDWKIKKDITNDDFLKYSRFGVKKNYDRYFYVQDAILNKDGSVVINLANFLDATYFRYQHIAKYDKDSNLIWRINGMYHHVMDVDLEGNIYALTAEKKDYFPIIDSLKKKGNVIIWDRYQVLSQEGKILLDNSIPEAFLGTKYEHHLTNINLSDPRQKIVLKDGVTYFEPLHANSIQYLSADLVEGSNIAEEGDVLISFKGIDTIAIIRPSINKVVWATSGMWQKQHYAKMDSRGKILIYDNEGAAYVTEESGKPKKLAWPRLLEYDTVTSETKVFYSADRERRMDSSWMGYHRVLRDGSFIFNSPEKSRVLQIGADKKIIWEMRLVSDRDDNTDVQTLENSRFYYKDELEFLP